VRIKVRVDASKADAVFKQARKEVNSRTKVGLIEGGHAAILPRVLVGAPAPFRTFLTVKATSRRAYVTTQGPARNDRALGLLNFGGTVRAKIVPDKKQALALRGTGVVVANVTTPRKYHGKHFIERGIESGLPELERIMLPTLMKSFDGLDHTP
jgi:hypothetical protein